MGKKNKVKALPSLVYRCGCTAPKNAEHLRLLQEQWFKANCYRNSLVRIELNRREAHKRVRGELDDRLLVTMAGLDATKAELDAIKAERGQRNMQARTRKNYPDLTARKKACLAKRKELQASEKALKAEFYKNPEHAVELEALESATAEARRAARKAASTGGLAWGTYLLVEDAATEMGQGKPPEFRAFHRENGGTVAVQIQSGIDRPRLLVTTLMTQGHPAVKLIPQPPPPNAGKRLLKRPRYKLQLCIGGVDPTKRISAKNPRQYVEVLVTLHRKWPENAHVTWVKLLARKQGPRLKWEVHFTLARETGFAIPTGDGIVGIDIGWRMQKLLEADEPVITPEVPSLRVAYWVGSDGQHGELVLPAKLVRSLLHKHDLDSVRDINFDTAKATLLGWCQAMPNLPEWLRERTKTLATWKSKNRLRRLTWQWQANRFDGDLGIFPILQAWSKQEDHVFNWLASEATRARNWREDMFRKFVMHFVDDLGYGYCGLEQINLQVMARKDDVHRKYHINRSMAAVGKLRNYLKARLQEILVPAAYTTKKCHRCGNLNDPGSSVEYVCTHCGWKGDRDYNGAANILRAATCELETRQSLAKTVSSLTGSGSATKEPVNLAKYQDEFGQEQLALATEHLTLDAVTS